MKRVLSAIILSVVLIAAGCNQQDLFDLTSKAQDLKTSGRLPSDVAGLALWLKADGITPLPDGTVISDWPDASGNGITTVVFSNPRYFHTAFNGMPAVRFDGSSYILASEFMNFSSFTIFYVGAYTGPGGGRHIIYDQGVTAGSTPFIGLHISTVSITGTVGDSQATPEFLSITSPLTPTTPHIAVFVLNGQNASLFLNGASSGGTLNLAYDSSTTWFNGPSAPSIGSQNGVMYYQGDIAEIIVYNNALSETDGFAVDCYLSKKYGIAVSHPCE